MPTITSQTGSDGCVQSTIYAFRTYRFCWCDSSAVKLPKAAKASSFCWASL